MMNTKDYQDEMDTKMTRKEWRVVFSIFAVPLAIVIFLFLPFYEEFEAPGQVIPVTDIGVEGSVHFVYVNSGYIENRIMKLAIMIVTGNQATFYPADQYIAEDYEWYLEDAEEYRLETIENALANAIDEAAAIGKTAFEDRWDQIVENTEDYYGDSFGLMLAIGLVEELNQEDFSQGGKYIIAGTGAMEPDGSVGSIGALTEKLIAAEEYGVDYFLLPKDGEYYDYDILSNEEEANIFMEDTNINLKIVPVESLEQALSFLRSLP